MGAFLAALGDGPHEVPHDTWRMLLGGSSIGVAKDDTLARYISELLVFGWVTRTSLGGRGSPRYAFSPPAAGGQNETLAPLLWGGVVSTLPQRGGRETASSPPTGGQDTPSSSPPPPPPPPDAPVRVSLDAERVMEERATVLDGCRGPMADYLAARVEPRRQGPYVWRVVTALEGGDEWMWKDRTGRTLHDGRTAVLAGAFNELLAGDEIGKHFPEPPGGYGNLRSKVRYLVASALGVDSDTTKAAGAAPTRPLRRPHADISHQGSLD